MRQLLLHNGSGSIIRVMQLVHNTGGALISPDSVKFAIRSLGAAYTTATTYSGLSEQQ